MIKLEEIKQLVSVLQDPDSSFLDFSQADETMTEKHQEYVPFLLSLIEEKDKALEQFANEENWMDIWDPTSECCKREWAPFGNPADIAHAALKSTKEE
jgi:hypothetical protein